MKDAVATPEDLLGQANEALGNADWAAARRLFAEALAPDQRQLAQPLGLFTPTRTQQGPHSCVGFCRLRRGPFTAQLPTMIPPVDV